MIYLIKIICCCILPQMNIDKLCHRYAAHFQISVKLLPYFQCYAPKKYSRVAVKVW